MKNRIVLVGCGNVGMSYAYALLNQHTYVDELVLIDIDKDKIEGEAMDLNHCLAYSPSKVNVRVGNYEDCKDAKIVVIAAGARQEVGESRMDLIHKNSRIFKSIVTSVMENRFEGIFLVATNPLDVMTYLTLKFSGLKPNRVIGTGTTLDTARLKYLISERIHICPKDIQAYVVGEHGDSEFVAWSNANIALTSMDFFLSDNEKIKIEEEVKNSAYDIIEKKGATYYGIGMCLVRITSAILEDKNLILPVSSYDKENNVCISTPAIVNARGVEEKIYIPLDEEETQKLENSIRVIKEAIGSLREESSER